jgi:protein arginine N-methyltransferase 1
MPKYQLTPDSIPLLLQLPAPVERDEVISRVAKENGIAPARLESLFEALLQTGILQPAEEPTAQPSSYSFGFLRLVNHRAMLADGVRMDGFRRALESVVKNGDVVIDVGSGSGILSFFAARAGAAKVFGLETTRLVDDARRLAKENRLDQVVEFIQCDAGALTSDKIGKSADVLVGEWIGRFVLDEWRHFEAFCRVRDTSLRPGGTVIPRKVHLFLAPISDARLYDEFGFGFWEKPLFGLDFRLGRTRQLEGLRMVVCAGSRDSLIGEPWEILDLDCIVATSDDYLFESSSEIRCSAQTICHGYLGYFVIDLAPGIQIDTSPFAMQTHWQQVYFPTESFVMQAGDLLVSHVKTERNKALGTLALKLSMEVKRGGTTTHTGSYLYPVDDRQIVTA